MTRWYDPLQLDDEPGAMTTPLAVSVTATDVSSLSIAQRSVEVVSVRHEPRPATPPFACDVSLFASRR